MVRFNSYFIIHGLNSGCFSSRDTMAYSERVGALDDLKVLSAEMKMCYFVLNIFQKVLIAFKLKYFISLN